MSASSPFQIPQYLEMFFVPSRMNEHVFVFRDDVEKNQLEQFADFVLDEVVDCPPSSFDTKEKKLEKMRRDRYHNFSPEQIAEVENEPDYITVEFKPFSSSAIEFRFVERDDGSRRLKEVWFLNLREPFCVFDFRALIPLFDRKKLNNLTMNLVKETSWFYKNSGSFPREEKSKNLTKSFKRLIRG